jgi:ribosomal protein S18 acetylase RimI-like enzyme
LRSSASPEYFANKITDPQRAVWVIEDKIINELVAYAIAGLCDIDDIPHPDVQTNKDGTLNRLYVRRDRQNYGFGRQLMNVILPWIQEQYPDRPI